MMALGILLAVLSIAGPISRFLQRADDANGLLDLSAITSLLAVVVVIAFFAGVAYAVVAIPAQTQLQEEIPEDVRGRVFGVLNMLVSVASFLPIIIVGPISDLVGTTAVILVVAALIGTSGVASYVRRGPLRPSESRSTAETALLGVVDLEPDAPGQAPVTAPPMAARHPRRSARHGEPGGPTLWNGEEPAPDASSPSGDSSPADEAEGGR
jgi:MFS family permease